MVSTFLNETSKVFRLNRLLLAATKAISKTFLVEPRLKYFYFYWNERSPVSIKFQVTYIFSGAIDSVSMFVLVLVSLY